MEFSLLRRAQFNFWRMAEPRAVFEWQSFYALKPLLKRLPKGDGHSVIVFPGFVGSDRSTKPMREILDALGYKSAGWGLGQNLFFDEQLEAEMEALVREEAEKSGGKVSLVGWSLGGVYAREIAKRCPNQVRCVIALGSPISGRMRQTHASNLFRAINGQPSNLDRTRYRELPKAPPVPTTSIFSKSDGIVAWEASKQETSELSENIEVPASHLGLGVNPLVIALLSNRLAQDPKNWQKFEPKWWSRLLIKTPK